MGLILASTSPRRRELLATLGLEFTVTPSTQLNEARELEGTAGDLEQRMQQLALRKGEEASRAAPNDVVLSADTVVVVGGEVLGKPRDVDDARQMLRRLSGRAHHVYTAVMVQRAIDEITAGDCERTRVSFNLLDGETIDRYIARAQPFDKAGAYAIQGLGALLVRKIEGDYANVVGLPLGLTAKLLLLAEISVL